MRAIVQQKYGPADVLQLRDIDPPHIAADQVLVRVRAAGVDPSVWHLMTGTPYPLRLAGYGLRTPKRTVPGGDVAGVVAAVGSDVRRLRPGDEVFGIGIGSYAEYARADADKLAVKPADLSFEQAAAIPISGLTALHGLRDHTRIEPGAEVLIIGASGGVGSYATQLAKAFGAHVTGVCSTAKVDLVRSLGADRVIDYTREDFTPPARRYTNPGPGYARILDTGGNTSLTRLRRLLTPSGTLVIVGGETGGRWVGGTGRLVRTPLLSLLVRQQLRVLLPNENHRDLLELCELIESGQLLPAIDRSFPLREAAEAIRYLQAGHARGKVVLSVPH